MTETTPAHRQSRETRTGDDHLIDPETGELRNLDQERREAAQANRELVGDGSGTALPPLDAGTVRPDPLDHDGDGRKGGMRGVAAKTKLPSVD